MYILIYTYDDDIYIYKYVNKIIYSYLAFNIIIFRWYSLLPYIYIYIYIYIYVYIYSYLNARNPKSIYVHSNICMILILILIYWYISTYKNTWINLYIHKYFLFFGMYRWYSFLPSFLNTCYSKSIYVHMNIYLWWWWYLPIQICE
jgi:hypothetical protein